MQQIIQFIKEANDATDKIFEGGIFVTLLVWIIIAIVAPLCLFLIGRIEKRVKEKKPSHHVPLMAHLGRALIYIFAGVGVVLQIVPLKATTISLLATSGVTAVVIGLACQQAFSGLISGIFISVFKPFVIGDRINIPSIQMTGFVEDITLYHTIIRSLQHNRIVIPNSLMNNYVIENVTKQENVACNYLDVSIAYTADLDAATKLMKQVCEQHPDCIDNPDGGNRVDVRVTELGDSGITLRAFLWSRDVGKGYVMLCDLRRDVKLAFDAAGIEIPYPCTNVYIREGRRADK